MADACAAVGAGVFSIPARFCVSLVVAAAIAYSPTTSNTAAPVASNVPVQLPFPVRLPP
jgi:hypothetical protein